MMATQAQSTANNFTMKTIPETDGNAKVTNTIAEISSMQTFKKEASIGQQERTSYDAASLDSIHVGYAGIGHYNR